MNSPTLDIFEFVDQTLAFWIFVVSLISIWLLLQIRKWLVQDAILQMRRDVEEIKEMFAKRENTNPKQEDSLDS